MNDMTDLLDCTLDDLEDLPEFKPFPVGAHVVLVTLTEKTIADKPAVEMDMKAVETKELANAEDEPLKPGDSTNIAFFLDNEFGRGKLKKVAKILGEALGTGNLREIVEQTNGLECLVITGQRTDKKDPDKVYTDVKDIAVV